MRTRSNRGIRLGVKDQIPNSWSHCKFSQLNCIKFYVCVRSFETGSNNWCPLLLFLNLGWGVGCGVTRRLPTFATYLECIRYSRYSSGKSGQNIYFVFSFSSPRWHASLPTRQVATTVKTVRLRKQRRLAPPSPSSPPPRRPHPQTTY